MCLLCDRTFFRHQRTESKGGKREKKESGGGGERREGGRERRKRKEEKERRNHCPCGAYLFLDVGTEIINESEMTPACKKFKFWWE